MASATKTFTAAPIRLATPTRECVREIVIRVSDGHNHNEYETVEVKDKDGKTLRDKDGSIVKRKVPILIAEGTPFNVGVRYVVRDPDGNEVKGSSVAPSTFEALSKEQQRAVMALIEVLGVPLMTDKFKAATTMEEA